MSVIEQDRAQRAAAKDAKRKARDAQLQNGKRRLLSGPPPATSGNGHAGGNGHTRSEASLRTANGELTLAGIEYLGREGRLPPKNGQAPHEPDFGDDVSRENGDGWGSFREALRSNRPVPKDLAAAAESGAEVEIGVERIQPHPANRHASDKDPDVIELSDSIATDGLLQAITVRPTCKAERDVGWPPAKEFEIIVGERRWRASRLAGRATVRAKIRTDVDDAQALRYIAIENAKRKDLNPIERARLIERLCTPASAGGAGLTLEAAAKDVGLKDPSSASNCRRLLQLPQVWQDRVAAGELPESFARLLVPVLPLAPVMKELEQEWKDREKPRQRWDNASAFASRQELEEAIDEMIDQECRCLYPDRKGQNAPEFDTANPAIAKQLGIVEMQLPTGGNRKLERVHVATNVKAYDEMLRKKWERDAKRQAEKSGRDAPAPKRELSPAEKKKQAQDRARQLGERVAAWRHKLLRRACIQSIDAGLDSGLRIVLAFAADRHVHYGSVDFGKALQEVRGIKPRGQSWQAEYWPCVAALGPIQNEYTSGDDVEGDVVAALAKRILADEAKDWRRPTLPHSLVDSYAAAIGIKLPQAWGGLRDEAGLALLEEFFLLHQTEQLRSLGKELIVFLDDAPNRGAMVKILLAKVRGGGHLPMPACIKPLAGGGKRKATTKAKAGKRGK